MDRIVCLIIGYVMGLIQTGFLYGKLHHIDIRKYGSGNVGTTNISRVFGKKAGFITYLGDALKAVATTVLIHFIFGGEGARNEFLLVLYGGIGVILGHNYPFYLKFKGGKGIATTSGVILSLFPYNCLLAILGFLTFSSVSLLTKYVSLGSLTFVTCFFIEFILFGQMGDLKVSADVLPEAYVIVFLITLLAYIRHRENIRRLLNGTERKIGQHKTN